jgi:hypothetical protein
VYIADVDIVELTTWSQWNSIILNQTAKESKALNHKDLMFTIWNAIAAHSCQNFFIDFQLLYRYKVYFHSWYWYWMLDLLTYLFTVLRPAQEFFHWYGDVAIVGEGLQNFGLGSVLRASEQGGIFIVLHLPWYRTSVFLVSSKGPPHSVASCDTRGGVEDLF